mgnify:CR=1 FL=1
MWFFFSGRSFRRLLLIIATCYAMFFFQKAFGADSLLFALIFLITCYAVPALAIPVGIVLLITIGNNNSFGWIGTFNLSIPCNIALLIVDHFRFKRRTQGPK